MRTTLASLTAIGLLFAAPAFAQTQPGQTTDRMQQTQTDPQGTPAQPGAGQPGMNQEAGQQGQTGGPGQPRAMTQDRLRQTLESAGFQQIQILDAAYLVQAQTEDGDTVFMVINPPMGAGGAGMAGTGSDRTPGAGGTSGSGATGATGTGQQPGTEGQTQRGTGGTDPNAPQQSR